MAMVKRCVIFITICPFWSSYISCPRLLAMQESSQIYY